MVDRNYPYLIRWGLCLFEASRSETAARLRDRPPLQRRSCLRATQTQRPSGSPRLDDHKAQPLAIYVNFEVHGHSIQSPLQSSAIVRLTCHAFKSAVKPIPRRFGSGGFISCRIAARMLTIAWSWDASFRSRRSNFRARDLSASSNLRIRTNDRMISMFTAMARSLLSTDDSIATPCSVNAYGA